MSKYTRRPVVEEEVCVHVMSRVIQKRFLIDDRGMEAMRWILRTQAQFAGMDVITFCFLKNHFHILLHVDPERARANVTDEELLRRFRTLYGTKRSPSLGVDAETLEGILKENGPRAEETRQRLKARMGNVSVFMRELKTRFTFWYNEEYQTVGTFWAERFRSVLVEPGSLALKAVAAYIDLNAVRAGLAETPQSYRYCGLGEAAGGMGQARAAYQWLKRGWKQRSGDNKIRTETDAYPDYEAYVNRIVTQILKEKAESTNTRNRPGNASCGENVIEEAPAAYGYQAKGGAVGSAAWVEKLCSPNGLFGFLRAREVVAVAEEMYAAKNWKNGD